ncbi:MAG: EAL domain-containing protein [Deltaproteobacteria bacterium]|nr:EAL domain-containing protein [Deltaproteobacteria bacterium]
MTNGQALRVLIVEHEDDDVQLALRELRKQGWEPDFRVVADAETLAAALRERPWDVVLSDYNLPGFDAPHALEVVQASGIDTPFLVVSGSVGEDRAVAIMAAGAHDFVVKDHPGRLGPAIERELREVAVRREKARAEEALHRLAFHSAVTGLPNRAWVEQRFAEVAAGESDAPAHALLLVDLHRFRDVNYSLDQRRGDDLLRQAGARLRDAFGDRADVCHVSGDNFLVLLPIPRGADDAAEAVRVALGALTAPFDLAGVQVEVSATAGVALSPEHGTDFLSLLRHADVACWTARRARAAAATYDPKLDEFTPRRLRLVADLRRAIDLGQLVLHYQPLVDLVGRRIVGIEALVRWKHPELGMVPPGEFIGLAEHTGAIRPLTEWVLQAALRDLARWRGRRPQFFVAVNVSARNLAEPEFADRVLAALAAVDAPGSALELEITESTIMEDPDAAVATLARLAAAGVRVAIDDFGTGYSSMTYLRRLPARTLKIDRSFVGAQRDGSPQVDRAIVRTIVDLGHALDVQITAEGIEDQQTLDVLVELGCDQGQGFFIGRPMAPPDLDRWLADSPWARP